MRYLVNQTILLTCLFCLIGCNQLDLSGLSKTPAKAFKSIKVKLTEPALEVNDNADADSKFRAITLEKILEEEGPVVDFGLGFARSIKTAVASDPSIVAAGRELQERKLSIESVRAQKDFQVTGSFYGGIEDVTDNTKGVAVVVNANRLLFDGGGLDSEIAASKLTASAAQHSLHAKMNERALRFSKVWVDLEKYQTLNTLVEGRLLILDPLILQLEQVANAGIGDVTQVASAQRTVSIIRVTQADLFEKLEQARINFENAFGGLPNKLSYESDFISGLMPEVISEDMVHAAPAIMADYDLYKAAEANLMSVIAKDKFKVGFEIRASRPFGGSGYDSDESLGVVARRSFFNGKSQEAETQQAEARVQSKLSKLIATHREGKRLVVTAQQTISAMDKAINLSRKNAEVMSDEIVFLRKQLVIGGSTLDKVLSAEARLYEAQSKEIKFLADRRKAELTILASLGLLGGEVGLY